MRRAGQRRRSSWSARRSTRSGAGSIGQVARMRAGFGWAASHPVATACFGTLVNAKPTGSATGSLVENCRKNWSSATTPAVPDIASTRAICVVGRVCRTPEMPCGPDANPAERRSRMARSIIAPSIPSDRCSSRWRCIARGIAGRKSLKSLALHGQTYRRSSAAYRGRISLPTPAPPKSPK